MNALNAVADLVYGLNAYQLTALTVIVGSALAGLAVVVGFLVLAAKSGAGEDCPADDKELPPESFTHAPDAACLRSVCAWCEPNAKGENITHGICPEHAEAMLREAELTRRYGPLK